MATVYIHEQVTDQIFCHEAFTFSIVIIYIYIYIYTYIRMAVANKVLYCGYIYIYILGGFNVFGVVYINLNPKVLVVASEF